MLWFYLLQLYLYEEVLEYIGEKRVLLNNNLPCAPMTFWNFIVIIYNPYPSNRQNMSRNNPSSVLFRTLVECVHVQDVTQTNLVDHILSRN